MKAPDWLQALPGIAGAMVLEPAAHSAGMDPDPAKSWGPALAAWPDRGLDDRLAQLQSCPVLLPEIYRIARHLPLGVQNGSAGPMLMADLRQQIWPMSAAEPQVYRPMATRLLPFLALPDGRLLRLIDDAAPPEIARPAALQAQLLQMLQGQAAGLQRLQAALNLLIARGHLLPDQRKGALHWQPAAMPAAPIGADAGPDGPLALRLLALLAHAAPSPNAEPVPNPMAMPMPIPSAMARLRDGLGRDAALQRSQFIDSGGMIDFSNLSPPGDPKADPPPQES